MITQFRKLLARHKIATAIVAVAVIGSGYYLYGKVTSTSAETRYVLAAAQPGTLVVAITASGQVSASNQLDIKPKVSGDVIRIAAVEGQTIKAGGLIAQLDSQDAEKSVRDAQANLQSVQISLQKLVQPADALAKTQAQNALAQAQQAQQNAQDDLVKSYDDGFNSVANAFLDLPGVVGGLDTILNSTTVNGSQQNAYAYYDLVKLYKPNADQFRDAALTSYQKSRLAYEKNLNDYKNASRYSDRATVEAIILETYDTAKAISETIKNTKNFLDLVNDAFISGAISSHPPSALAAHENSLQTYTGTVNGHLGTLLSIKNTIKNDQDTIISSAGTIIERTESLAKLTAGADPLDIQSQQLAVQQRQNALLDARQTLANYFIRAPFDGVVAKINVKKGDPASSGTVVATVITPQKIAQVSLNEVDVAKVVVGQKVTLTFDAFPDLTIVGAVAQIDTIGAVTQGVVTYNVKITFQTEDDRVKPAMSVSAAIITATKTDALLVPNGAVKSQGGAQYVEVLDGVTSSTAAFSAPGITSATPPRRQTVRIGLANDTMTEITSGVQAGDLVVARTITAATTAAATTQSTFRIPGLGGGGGGGGR